ncbi:MAG: DNA topoisomerase VI subunit B, partial [Candidatus Woesearchaeota archaeon]
AQLTTGKPAEIISKTDLNSKANQYKLKINTQTNNPDILEEKEVEWEGKEHGTKIEFELEGSYFKGKQSVDEYLKETAITNPHCTIIYTNPMAEQIIFPRATEEMPEEPKEIKPHPYGVELGMLIKMLEMTEARTLQAFLIQDFSRVGPGTAKEICENSALLPNSKPKKISREMAEQLYHGIQKTKIIAPPTNCLSPITAELLEKGLRKEINAEFYTSVTRPPSVYRGNPFVIECCTGDSKLILEDGTVIPIKDYVENEDYRKVLSLDENLKITPTKILAKQKFKNIHKLLRLKTKSGRELTLTANNEVPIISNGQIIWKKTEEVSSGEYIAVPKQIDVEGKIPSFLDLIDKQYIQVLNKSLVKDLIAELSFKFGNLKDASKELSLPYERLKAFKRDICTTRPYLNELEDIALILNKDIKKLKKEIKEIRYVDNKFYNPKKITLPEIDEDLLYILGLLESDGYISKKGIVFVNLDSNLHQSFKQKTESLFGIEIKKYKHNSYFCNKTAYHLLTSLKKEKTSLPNHLIIAWLKGFVDGDGWVNLSKREIGIATAEKEKAQLVQTLLLRLNILSSIKISKIPKTFGKIGEREVITKKEKHNIIITGYSNVKKFKDILSFRQTARAEKINKLSFDYEQKDTGEIIPIGNLLKLFREENRLFQHELGLSDTSIRQIEKGRHNITAKNLSQAILQKEYLGQAAINILKLINSDILCDKIVDIKLMPNEEYVYDLTTENGNFVSNNIVMHNCALAYGGEQDKDSTIKLLRYANRVPLIYQPGACATNAAVVSTAWRPYGLSQSKKSLPIGPCTIVVHMASVWVPFTSEAKESIAHYPEIIKEIQLAVRECGRKLGMFINKKKRIHAESKKRSYIETYIPYISEALEELIGITDKEKVEQLLNEILEKQRGVLEEIKVDNPDYDEDFAKIGREDDKEENKEEE